MTQRISGRVWHDLDADGTREDGSEPRIAGVVVKLYESQTGLEIASTTTNANGEYAFNGILLGNYEVAIPDTNFQSTNPLRDFHYSPQDAAGDDTVDSDFSGTTGRVTVTLTLGNDATNIDGGFYKYARIAGKVWEDLSNDGILDASELGIESVQLCLYVDANGDGTLDAGDSQASCLNSDVAGDYAFASLIPGSYLVQVTASNFDPGAALEGYTFVPGPDSGPEPFPATLLSGDTATANFGYYRDNSCEPVGLDVFYIIDASASMSQPYTGAQSKLEAAKQAIIETNDLLESFNNDSRVALYSYQGSSNGDGIPPTHAVYHDYWTFGLTNDFDYADSLLDYIGANGNTPTPHALRYMGGEAQWEQQIDPSRIPIIILISDGAPTIAYEPSLGLYSGYFFQSQHVAPISVLDGSGGFRSIADVRDDGIFYSGYNQYSGEVLADTMEATQYVRSLVPNVTIHAVAIQGQDGGGTFNDSILKYVAAEGGGEFADPSNSAALRESIANAVRTSACD